MHNVLIISYIAFSIGNLFILPESLAVLLVLIIKQTQSCVRSC